MVGDPNGKPCIAGTFYNACAFESNLTPGTYGDEARNSVRGPGYQTWDRDVTVGKMFPIKEHESRIPCRFL